MRKPPLATGISTLLFTLIGAGTAALAVSVPPKSDAELVQAPLIVVARWDGRPAEEKPNQVSLLTLEIERVIRGDLEPGRHRLLHSTVYFFPRRVKDLSRTHLWFLERGKSYFDDNDTATYLRPFELDGRRTVQSLALEPYYQALLGGNLKKRLPDFLAAKESPLVIRALETAAGGFLPWPFEPARHDRPGPRKAPWIDLAPRVEGLLSVIDPAVRASAAAVYSLLVKNQCLAKIRPLLSDVHPEVRAVAIGILARHLDKGSASAINKAASQIEDTLLACRIIEALASWRDEAVAIGLMVFLEDDGFAYRLGRDLGVPALMAQTALKESTGYVFPFDVAASRAAWAEAVKIADRKARLAQLARSAPFDPEPFSAGIVFENQQAWIQLTNHGPRPVTIPKRPNDLDIRCYGSYGRGWGVKGADDFLILPPGATHRFPVDLPPAFLEADPKSRSVELTFRNLGHAFGHRAWMGTVAVAFVRAPKDFVRVERTEEEHWPNGALKARGVTVNGKRHGVWTYWTRDGQKEKEIHFVHGMVSKIVQFRTK
jgi:hypothetical protein